MINQSHARIFERNFLPFILSMCILVVILDVGTLRAQPNITTNNVIITPVSFLNVSPNSRAGGMGDLGVATSTDQHSLYWNVAKMPFMNSDFSVSLSHVPWLFGITNDIFISSFYFQSRVGSTQAVGLSVRFFKLGDIELTDQQGKNLFTTFPFELSIDLGYALKLTKYLSFGLTGKYVLSDIVDTRLDPLWQAATSFAIDAGLYFQSIPARLGGGLSLIHRAGLTATNIGGKMSYTTSDAETAFLPANLRVGYSIEFVRRVVHSFTLSVEAAKLMVPTPPLLDENGEVQSGTSTEGVGTINGILRSFNDAPDGFGEELKEITYATGFEYKFANTFSLRTGFFYEAPEKGDRTYATLGAGIKYNVLTVDASYLLSFSSTTNPLSNVLRFSLSFDIGEAIGSSF